jgi:minor extracellular protease Epr
LRFSADNPPMSQRHRPKRFIIVPKDGLADRASTPAHTLRLMAAAAPGAALALAGGAAAVVQRAPRHEAVPRVALAPGLKVVNKSPPDGALLVQAAGRSAAQIQARVPAGVKVFEEQWYSLQRARAPWRAADAIYRKPLKAGVAARTFTVRVRLDDAKGTPLKDALVTAMVNHDKAIGAEGITDRRGRVRFQLGRGLAQLEALYVDPLHSGWPIAIAPLVIGGAAHEVKVPPIDLSAADARNLVHDKAAAGDGRGVKVAVVDTGVGKHSAITVAGGRNTTEESPRRVSDWDGHGTHVAGVIAAAAAGWRRGEASAAALYAYRIFQQDDDEASTFAISTAIKQAALDGCDLVNLSIGGGVADGSVRDAIEQAWNLGTVCVAATGNDGAAQVDYPARYPKSQAVSAIGVLASWPAGAYLEWTLSKWRGKQLGGHDTFFASFSNRGDKVALTAPGVAIVSTIFGNRWGVMSGTSMATPIATGVLARRLAASPVLGMPRDAVRAAAIVALAHDHAEDIGLHARMQGRGLAR